MTSLRAVIYDRAYMQEPPPPRRAPWSLTVTLIVVNTAVYALSLIAEAAWGRRADGVLELLALVPEHLAHGWVWQLLTFQFLHATTLHLVLNCAMLYMFGRPMEQSLGRATFLRLYLGSGAVGGLLQTACSLLFPGHFGTGGTVGASAGVFGLIAAFAFLNRDASITTFVAFIIPVTMKAKYLLVVESILALIGMLGQPDRVAHAAHLGGMLGALAYLQVSQLAAQRRFRWPRLRAAPAPRELVGARVPRIFNHQEAQTRKSDTPLPPDFISREVDPILDKISAHGIQSLTERERRILELARSRMSQR